MAATLTDEALNMFEALLGCAFKKTERAHGGRVPFVRRVPVSLRRRGKFPRNSLIRRISDRAAWSDTSEQAAAAYPTDSTATKCYNRYS
jgi:hypothetical protein